jgi:signal transduction histidine kinase
VRIQTDPDKLRQVLLNLAGNGVRYTPTGSVTVELIPRDREIEVVVRDTGVGIAPEHLSQIFEPFWQVDRTQRARGGGTGLGLSVVHRVVALLGGTVRVQSEVGSGSVFTVTLPIESATAAP